MAKRFFNGENDWVDRDAERKATKVRRADIGGKISRRDFSIPEFLLKSDAPPSVQNSETSSTPESAPSIVPSVEGDLSKEAKTNEETYDLLEPIKYREYIKGLKPSQTHDASPWPTEIKEAFQEIGAVEVQEIKNRNLLKVGIPILGDDSSIAELTFTRRDSEFYLKDILRRFNESRLEKKEADNLIQRLNDLKKKNSRSQTKKSTAIKSPSSKIKISGKLGKDVDISGVINPYGVSPKKARDISREIHSGNTFTEEVPEVVEVVSTDIDRGEIERATSAAEIAKKIHDAREQMLSRQQEEGSLLLESEDKKTEKIAAVTTFKELEKVVQEIGDVQIGDKQYSVQELLKWIGYVRSNILSSGQFAETHLQEVLNHITSTYGLRDKVEELVKSYQKILNNPGKDQIATTENKPVNDSPDGREEPTIHEGPATFDSRFTSEFGISEEDLVNIKGFESLSVPQQKLVFENLKEYAESGAGSRLEHIWKKIKVIGFKLEDDGVPRRGSRGLKEYEKVLTQLVQSAATYGPKVHEGEDGLLMPDLVQMDIPRENREVLWSVVSTLNLAAHKLSKTQASWQDGGIGTHAESDSRTGKVLSFLKKTFSEKEQKYNEYQEIQQSYESAKKQFATALERSGMSVAEVVEKLVAMDGRVFQLQFAQTSPDAVEAVQSITDDAAWTEVAKGMVKNAGVSFGLGFVTRTATSGMLGWLSGPFFAVGLAGTRSWNESAALLRERDRNARMGIVDTEYQNKYKELLFVHQSNIKKLPKAPDSSSFGSVKEYKESLEYKKYLNTKEYQAYKESENQLNKHKEKNTNLNIVSAVQSVEIDGKKKDRGLIQKTEDLIDRVQTLIGSDSEVFAREIGPMMSKLRARVEYIEDKQRLNRINFGSKEDVTVNMAKMYEVLGQARVLLASYEKRGSNALLDRLDQYINYRENSIQGKRRALQRKKLIVPVVIAGGFSFAGAAIAAEIKGEGFFNRADTVPKTSLGGTVPAPSQEGISSSKNLEMKLEKEGIAQAQARGVDNSILEKVRAEASPSPYIIQSGDTFTKILKEQIPGIKDLGDTKAQENTVANILKSLTKEQLAEIGIRGGNVDHIYAGQNIDTEKLAEILESKKDIIESAKARFGDAPRWTSSGTGTSSLETVSTVSPVNLESQVVFEEGHKVGTSGYLDNKRYWESPVSSEGIEGAGTEVPVSDFATSEPIVIPEVKPIPMVDTTDAAPMGVSAEQAPAPVETRVPSEVVHDPKPTVKGLVSESSTETKINPVTSSNQVPLLRAELVKLSSAELSLRLSPEDSLVAETQKLKMLSLFDKGEMFDSTKGIDTPLWKAVADKPVEFLLAQNNPSIRKTLVDAGRLDAKYLNDSKAFLIDILGVKETEILNDTRFGKVQNYLKDFVQTRRFTFLPNETTAQYIDRASKIYALKT